MEWQAYAEIEPFGDERADLRSAIVAQVIAEVNRDSKRRPEPYKAAEFMPDFNRLTEPVTQDPEQGWAILKMAFGGK